MGKMASAKSATDAAGHIRLVTRNRRARHEYEIMERMEAGIVLTGTEVKALRAGNVNLKDSYAAVDRGEVFLLHAHISAYEPGNRFNHEPERDRKLLLHRAEIRRLIGRTQQQGLTLIPLSLYFRDGKAKVELALARGRKQYDKRQNLAQRDAAREVQRALKERSH